MAIIKIRISKLGKTNVTICHHRIIRMTRAQSTTATARISYLSSTGQRMQNSKYIITKRFGILEISEGVDQIYRDKLGTVYAIEDQGPGLDPVARCGIWPFVMPTKIAALEEPCSVHDYMHQSTAYQTYHTMREANLEMLRLHYITTRDSWTAPLATIFYYVTVVASPMLRWGRKK